LQDAIKSGKAGEEAQKATGTKGKDIEIITNIGSGLNWKTCKGIQGLLEQVLKGLVRMIVVLHKDCLCCFAFDLIEWMCWQHDCKIIMVHGHGGETETTHKLANDLFAITNVFVVCHNGLQAAENACCQREGQGGEEEEEQERGEKAVDDVKWK